MATRIRRSICVIIMICLLLSGCSSYCAYKTYYDSPSDYPAVWELAGLYPGESDRSPLFPEDIRALEVESFFCRYDEQLPLGEGVQMLLHIRYDETDFVKEVQRIEAQATDRTDAFDCAPFQALALCLGTEDRSEYALIDTRGRSIYYVYLYNLPKDQLEIDPRFLPIGYTGLGEVDDTVTPRYHG